MANKQSDSSNCGLDILNLNSAYIRNGKDFAKATNENQSFDEWIAALRLWLKWNPQIYFREEAHEILSRSKEEMKEYYQDGFTVVAVALGISMNFLLDVQGFKMEAKKTMGFTEHKETLKTWLLMSDELSGTALLTPRRTTKTS